MNKKIIYLDNAATTPLDPRVKAAMEPYLTGEFGNPSSLYDIGRKSKMAVERARKGVSKIFNCLPEEIVFTRGGTESDNLAVLGVARHAKAQHINMSSSGLTRGSRKLDSSFRWNEERSGCHIITSSIEHHAVLIACKQLEKEGFEVTYLPVDPDGLVRVEDVRKAIRPKTVLVSIMYANNEIGTIQPIEEIGKLVNNVKASRLRSKNTFPIHFHTDACQAAGYLDLNVDKLGVDLMTINGSKIYGPKGGGVLYKRRGVEIEPLMYGGSQENGVCPGTENVAGIVGLVKALEILNPESGIRNHRVSKLRDRLITGITERIPKVRLNGHPTTRLPNNVNVSILDIEGEGLILALDEQGVAVSTGSACTAADLSPSHVILALGLSYEAAHGSLRLTLGKDTSKEDIDYVLDILPAIVRRLRQFSPLDLPMERFVREVK